VKQSRFENGKFEFEFITRCVREGLQLSTFSIVVMTIASFNR